ncbi:hypothetical protein J2Y58_002913 [Sphingomonas sp. BE138]|uniref:hypothetical protein n=1 Tax=Sphingomonas sp. BE138 TaxID=2817845 RepID=UPI00285BB365|nr:hypothetical protein [Sphingomonas sp. BE138]MDR6789540.1 hypothetical protein [Sphingomonas sp. BE138]
MTQPVHPMLTAIAKRMGDQMDFDGEPFGATLSTSELVTLARAAIQALLEPDEGMKRAGADELFGSVEDDWTVDARRIFQAMLRLLIGESK